MLEHLILFLIFVANFILIYKLRPYKDLFASGVEITLVGIFLSGYWFGYKAGAILGIVFMASSFVASMDFGPELFISLPLAALLGLFGAGMAIAGIGIATGGLIGVILYCLISDIIFIKVFEGELFRVIATDICLVTTSFIFLRVFF